MELDTPKNFYHPRISCYEDYPTEHKKERKAVKSYFLSPLRPKCLC